MTDLTPFFLGFAIVSALGAAAIPVAALAGYRRYTPRLATTRYIARFKVGWLLRSIGAELVAIGTTGALALFALDAGRHPLSESRGFEFSLPFVIGGIGGSVLLLAGLALTQDALIYLRRHK